MSNSETPFPAVKVDIEQLRAAFKNKYKAEPLLVKSPGRINIIGEHTDYNNGFVMPAAIDKAIYVGISKRIDDEIHLHAAGYNQTHTTSLNTLSFSAQGWPNYVLGVVDQLLTSNFSLSGFNLYIDGDVPPGAGLSSSAALECATAHALNELFHLGVTKLDIAYLAQKAEHAFAGVNCGIMDQFASVFGMKNHAMLLDCRSMEYQYLPLDLAGYTLLLLNTNVKHSLADSAYNQRRQQCEQGVAWVKTENPEVESLRDVTFSMLHSAVKPKDPDVYAKCRYVLEENQRLIQAGNCLKTGDLEGLGKLMFETHTGLSKYYNVSCKELDFLVNAVKGDQLVLGARMMGGGFGGCTLNIVKTEYVNDLIRKVSAAYSKEFGLTLDAYPVAIANGTEIVN